VSVGIDYFNGLEVVDSHRIGFIGHAKVLDVGQVFTDVMRKSAYDFLKVQL